MNAIAPITAATVAVPEWFEAEQPRKIFATIEELCAINRRLQQLDDEHRFVSIGEAADVLGHLVYRTVPVGLAHDYGRALVPSNGASAVQQLWGQLREHRDNWVRAQLADRGIGNCHNMPRGPEAQAASDAYHELDDATPSIEAAWGMVGAARS